MIGVGGDWQRERLIGSANSGTHSWPCKPPACTHVVEYGAY